MREDETALLGEQREQEAPAPPSARRRWCGCWRTKRADERRVVEINNPEANKAYPRNVVSNTKYSLLNFIPKNLYEQFSRHMNRYFLLIAFLQLFHELTPVHPATTWTPLVLVLMISATKEAFDDIGRWRRDRAVNKKPCTILHYGSPITVLSENIRVGDIVRVGCDEEIPCDLVLIASSNPSGHCKIQTTNVDGESDFKARHTPMVDRDLVNYSAKELGSMRGTITIESQKEARAGTKSSRAQYTSVHDFDAKIQLGDLAMVVESDSFLPQSCHIRHTDHVYGVAVYTGKQTKLARSRRVPPSKWTHLDALINKYSILVFLIQLLIVCVYGAMGDVENNENEDHWYLLVRPISANINSFLRLLVIPIRFLLLCSLMIPISLKVTLDFVKYFYALMIGWDNHMYDAERDIRACANSTALSEDLGQIQYILTDKTGTLTENLMVFKCCCINGTSYGVDTPLSDTRDLVARKDGPTIDFFRVLAACNMVIPFTKDDEVHYECFSPDEEALVKAAADAGVQLTSRDNKVVTMDVGKSMEEFSVLNVLDFDSERKRMTVILRNASGNGITLMTKGADERIMPMLKRDSGDDYHRGVLESFAEKGLRTLCVASRSLSAKEYDDFKREFDVVNLYTQGRKQAIEALWGTLEKDLTLHGITAIEDKLQAGVPDTIELLRRANIKFVMLTGDKAETAVEIAHSSRFISRGTAVKMLSMSALGIEDNRGCLPKVHETLVNILKEIGADGSNERRPRMSEELTGEGETAIVIEGKVLRWAMEYADLFGEVIRLGSAVICCRVQPQQKGEVVALVKKMGFVTLAVGDGGNDVNMVQEAHVGVGIAGREGLQAARASDYSISQFRFLKRLILVHGRYSYNRTAFIAQYCFYKSIFICVMQLFFAPLSAFSGATFLNSFSLMGYNTIYTNVPVLAYCLDKDVDIVREVGVEGRKDTIDPQIYLSTQRGDNASWSTGIGWIARAVFQGCLLMTFTVLVYGPSYIMTNRHGSPADFATVSMAAFTVLVLVQTLTVALESHTWSLIHQLVWWGTIAVYFILNTSINAIPPFAMFNNDMLWVMFELYKEYTFWAYLLLTTVAVLAPVIAIKYYCFMHYPTDLELKIQRRWAYRRAHGITSHDEDRKEHDSHRSMDVESGAAAADEHTGLLAG